MTIILRPYQETAIQNAIKALNEKENTLGIAATGAGKTTVFCQIAGKYNKVLILQHTIELLRQNKERFEKMFPDKFFDTAEYSADVKNIRNYTFGSMQTVARLTDGGREKSLPSSFDFDLLIIDECHHSESKSYQNIVKNLKLINPNIHTLGLTATAMRGDGKILGLFDNVSFEISIKDLIAQGYLINPQVYAINVGLLKNMQDKSISIADLDKENFKDLLNTKIANEEMVRHWIQHASNRQTIIFTGSVEHANELAEEFRLNNYHTAVVTEQVSKRERKTIIESYKHKEIQILINVFTLTEGFDAPSTSCVVIAKAMCHAGMYIQIVGRGLRTANDKNDCIVLDFGVSTFFNQEALRHGIEAEIKGTEKRTMKRLISDFKECPVCKVFNTIRERYCVSCNYDFVTKNGQVAFIDKQNEKLMLNNIELIKLEDFFVATAFQFADIRGDGKILVAADELAGAVCIEVAPGDVVKERRYIGILKRKSSPQYEIISVSEKKLVTMTEIEKALKPISGKRGCLRGTEYMKLPVSSSQFKILSAPEMNDLYNIPKNMYQGMCCIFWGKHRKNMREVLKVEVSKMMK